MKIKLTKIVIVALLTTICGEVFARLFLTSPLRQTFDSELGYTNIPNSQLFINKEGGARITFNAIGVNDTQILPNSPARIQILLIGDSITEAIHVKAERNFASVAERLDKNLDVINGGRAALSPVNYPLYLKRLLGHIKPDYIVLCFHSGDYWDLTGSSSSSKLIRNESGKIVDVQPKSSAAAGLKNYLEPITQKSSLAIYLARRYKPMIDELRNGGEEAKDKVNDATENLHESDIIDKRNAARIILNRLKTIGEFGILYFDRHSYPQTRWTAKDRIPKREMELLSKQLEIPFVDATPYLDAAFIETGQPPLGFHNLKIGYGHLNELGHRAVANGLVDLATTLRSKKRDPSIAVLKE